jgi:hypothetical protein
LVVVLEVSDVGRPAFVRGGEERPMTLIFISSRVMLWLRGTKTAAFAACARFLVGDGGLGWNAGESTFKVGVGLQVNFP